MPLLTVLKQYRLLINKMHSYL